MSTVMHPKDTSAFFWVAYFALPLDADPTSAPRGPGQMVCSPTNSVELEDLIRETVENWTEFEQAIVYWYLHADGMNLERAKTIRRKARFVP